MLANNFKNPLDVLTKESKAKNNLYINFTSQGRKSVKYLLDLILTQSTYNL